MAKRYTGSLTLEWYNKQKAIMLKGIDGEKKTNDIPAPQIKWVNKDEALFYEINEKDGIGQFPYWVNRNDLRVKESRPLILVNTYTAEKVRKGTEVRYSIIESREENNDFTNIIIKGDNLLSLNALKKIYKQKHNEEKVKCIYIDPPYNTDSAFELYDDNLAKSEWLTLMRDRILILRELLREDGLIFINIDDNSVDYLGIVMDEIFGNENRFDRISVKTSASQGGFGDVNPGLISNTEYILIYCKNKSLVRFNEDMLYVHKEEYDENYQWIIKNYEDAKSNPSEWQIANLNELFYEEIEIPGPYNNQTWRKVEEKLGSDWKDLRYRRKSELAELYKESVFRTFNPNKPSKYLREVLEMSKDSSKVLIATPENSQAPKYCYKGEVILFYKTLFKEIDGVNKPANKLTTFWSDISWEGIANEGNVKLRNGKKPEKLIKRILDISTEPGDIVLDCFGGSGTTYAVALKMGRRFIGIEIGCQADDLIIPRLRGILLNKDSTGISRIVNWGGGGSFSYYRLGDSILNSNDDFNWDLGVKFLQESLLQSYDYNPLPWINVFNEVLFEGLDASPSLGIQRIGQKIRIAVISLCSPEKNNSVISQSEFNLVYQTLKKKYSPDYINFFTNRGIDIPLDIKPDDTEIFKIPQAIFAELEK